MDGEHLSPICRRVYQAFGRGSATNNVAWLPMEPMHPKGPKRVESQKSSGFDEKERAQVNPDSRTNTLHRASQSMAHWAPSLYCFSGASIHWFSPWFQYSLSPAEVYKQLLLRLYPVLLSSFLEHAPKESLQSSRGWALHEKCCMSFWNLFPLCCTLQMSASRAPRRVFPNPEAKTLQSWRNLVTNQGGCSQQDSSSNEV